MNKLVRIFLAGIAVMVPFAVTVYVIWYIGSKIDPIGHALLPENYRPAGLGVLVVIVCIFLVGLLARFWLFRQALLAMERMLRRVPVVKTLYESVRDLMKLFGQDSRRMGRAVLYTPPGTQISLLAILTSQHPAGLPPEEAGRKVAIYVPMAYMFGGPVFYVPAEHVRELDIPVEQAIKLAAMAQVGTDAAYLLASRPAAPDASLR